LAVLFLQAGCWAPLKSVGIPATALPDTFRIPMRTSGAPLNFASLTIAPPQDYILGPNDQLDVTIAGLSEGAELRPMRVQIMSNGAIYLPLVGSVKIGGMNLLEAQQSITAAYSDRGFLANPQVNLVIFEKGATSVLVLGEVNAPGVHVLPKYQNDVGHALAAAGGLSEEAADEIEVHRRSLEPGLVPHQGPYSFAEPMPPECRRLPPIPGYPWTSPSLPPSFPVDFGPGNAVTNSARILRIPLRTRPGFRLTEADITLHDGDVIVVPGRRHEVFYVVGKLGTTNTVRFTVGDRERELGVGFILPRDREIDVVTAVAMAGYIDPIDSPTTVTLQRAAPDGTRTLILVDLIEARCNPRATVLVEPGDIIYLNPDGAWYMRRTIDRILPELLLSPYNLLMRRWILGRGNL
jgi:protein involved in polysaccharide export with SLBB domain